MKLKLFFALLGLALISVQSSYAQFYMNTPYGVITFGPNGPDFSNFRFVYDPTPTVPVGISVPITPYTAYPTTVDSNYSSSNSCPSSNCSSSSSSHTRTCTMLTGSDYAHCNGTGVCQRCNGKGTYYDTSFGNACWKTCVTCNGSGKCPSCHGSGVRY